MIHRRKFLKTAAGIFVPCLFLPKAMGQLGLMIGDVASDGNGQASSTPPTDTPFLTGQTLGTLRNNLTGKVGFEFRPTSNMTVTQLGRWVVSGNSGSHVLELRTVTNTLLQSCTVNTSGATSGQYLYGTITAQSLSGGTNYMVVSNETSSGDQWYDLDTTITTSSGTLVGSQAGTGANNGDGAHSYVPVNFQFH